MTTDLGQTMLELAERDRLPQDHPMRTTAERFNASIGTGNPETVLGAWARARRVYCDYTGEPLL